MQETVTQILQIPIAAIFVWIFLFSIPISNFGFKWMYLALIFFYAYQSSLYFPHPNIESIILNFGVLGLVKILMYMTLVSISSTLPLRILDLVHQSPFSNITTPLWKSFLSLMIYFALFKQMQSMPDFFSTSIDGKFQKILHEGHLFSIEKISVFLISMQVFFKTILILLIPTFAYASIKLLFEMSMIHSHNQQQDWFKSLEIIIEICFWLISFPLILNLSQVDL